MALYDTTLAELVEQVCRIVHDWTEGIATGGDATKLQDSTYRVEADDYWSDKGSYIYIRSGLAIGNYRKVKTYKNTNGEITPYANFSGAIAASDTYSLHTDFPRDEVVEMINLAIDMVAEEALLWKVDETSVTLVASTYEYSLPTDFMYIFKVTMANSDGTFGDQPPIDPSQYRIVHSAVPKLRFSPFPDDQKYSGHYYGQLWAEDGLVADRALRIEGLGTPDVLSADSSTCAISPAYVAFQAAALLHLSRVRRAGEDPDNHSAQATIWQKRADIERGKIVPVQLPADSKRCRE